MVSIEPEVLSAYCRELSAHVSVYDVWVKSLQLARDIEAQQFPDPIHLQIPDPQWHDIIETSGYSSLLRYLLDNIRIHERCLDVFRSELDAKLLDFFSKIIPSQAKGAAVIVANDRYEVHCSAVVSDILVPILGRHHKAFVLCYQEWTKALAAVNGDPSRLFVKTTNPSPWMNFPDIWIGGALGVREIQCGPIAVI